MSDFSEFNMNADKCELYRDSELPNVGIENESYVCNSCGMIWEYENGYFVPTDAYVYPSTEQFSTWEIGVHPVGNPGDWEHHHPTAETEEKARKKSIKQAQKNGMMDPYVYMVTGPYNPDSYTPNTDTQLQSD